jgi:uncharacterized membrane protein
MVIRTYYTTRVTPQNYTPKRAKLAILYEVMLLRIRMIFPMIALIIFILGVCGTGFTVTRAWSLFALFTLSFGYPLTWIGLIGVWMLRGFMI